VETIVHYMAKYSQELIQRKLGWLSPHCPLGDIATPTTSVPVEPAPMGKAVGVC